MRLKPSPEDEVSSKLDPPVLIHSKHLDGGPPDGRETGNHWPAKFKMVLPELVPGVKEALDPPGLGIYAREIWPLKEIAEGATVTPLKLTSIDLIRRFR